MEDESTNAAPGAEGGGDHHSVQETQQSTNGIEDRIETSALRSSPHPADDGDGSSTRSNVQPEPQELSGQSQEDQAADGRIIKKEDTDESHIMSSHLIQALIKEEQNSLMDGIQGALGDVGNTYGTIYDPDRPGPCLPLPSQNHQIDDITFLDSAASMVESEAPRIQAFAKLEFDDGQFYMNTYAVELGRDIRAAKRALEQDLGAGQEQGMPGLRRHRSNSSADMAQTSRKLKREDSMKVASSVVSESGGIMNLDMQEAEPRKRSRGKKTKSESSSSRNLSRKNSIMLTGQQTDYQSLAEASLDKSKYGVHPVDALSLMPSPDECPLIPIHPPQVAQGGTVGHRGISRRHVRIAYNFDKRLFEVEVKGRNGAFVDEQFFSEGRTAELKSGSYIQIGGVGVRFILPNVAIGETGAEPTIESEAVSAMSFDFEDGKGESIAMTDSDSESSDSQRDTRSEEPEANAFIEDESSSNDEEEQQEVVEDDMEDDEDSKEEAEEEEILPVSKKAQIWRKKPIVRPKEPPKKQKTKLKLKLKLKQKLPPKVKQPTKSKEQPKVEVKTEPLPSAMAELGIPASMIPPKRKGPGRPPKNGIMSKREQALIMKQVREEARARAIADGTLLPEKKKEIGELQTEKRKYTKRKKPDDQPDDPSNVLETMEGDDPKASVQNITPLPKIPKEKRAPKAPRSPSPVFDEATLTPEQLAKPQQSYVVLIHEALSNSKTGQMSLPQIYRAIERKYPFYKLRVTTVGWQSSVRHNLSQHAAFRKIERDGKGWMWGLVPEVSIEKERKRRPSPPPMQPQTYYPPGPHMYRPPYPYPGLPPPPNGQMPPHAGQSPYLYPLPPGQGFPPPGVLPRSINGLPVPLAAPQNNANSTYQSPYTPAPQTQVQPQNHIPAPQSSSETPQPRPQPDTKTSSHPGDTQLTSNQHANAPAAKADREQLPVSTEAQPAGLQIIHSPSTPNQPPLPQYILDAVAKFKSVLMSSLSPTKQNAEEIITSAINRTLGTAPPGSEVPQREDPEERLIMVALKKMLEQLKEKDFRNLTSVPPPSNSPAPQNTSSTVQPRPLHRVPETGSHQTKSLAAAVSPVPPTPPQDTDQTKPKSPPSKAPLRFNPQTTSPNPPVPQTQQAQILSLLQQLGQKIPDPSSASAENGISGTATEQAHVQTLPRGIEAAEQVVGEPITGMETRGAKRRFDADEGAEIVERKRVAA